HDVPDELKLILLLLPAPLAHSPPHSAANVCDNELLHCQNGGTCHNNVRCLCPAAYTGILCEKLRCEEAGSCGSDSGQGAPPRGSPALLLLLLLLLLLTALLGTASPLEF
ncbi:PREDICTED: netrin-G1-like, partial [Galeopterus variegatus]|uniref:Netrin-G1-like n=1 Tax=Galeopterus variegatus TaxID=482537 RepID=A0ABM0SIE4_GALVR